VVSAVIANTAATIVSTICADALASAMDNKFFSLVVYAAAIADELLYFIEYNVCTSIVGTFILQIYLNTLFMYKVGECYFPNIMRRQYFSTI
jgi:hypothetical protein